MSNKKYDLATTESVTTTYAGEFASKYISAALLSADTIENGGVEVIPNVKYKHVISKLETSGLQKDATCDFDPTATVTLTERILEPKQLQVNLQLCKATYRNTWEAEAMGYSAHDTLAPSFADYLVSHVAASVAEANETNIWSGDSANNGEFDGFETILTNAPAQPAAQELAGTTVTAANVIAQIQLVVDAIPSAVWGKEDLKIFIPINIAKHYIAAQAALGYRDLYNDGQTNLNFQGVDLFVANGMTDDVMIAAQTSNLYFGTGLLSDHNEVKVIDTADLLGDENVRVIMRYTAGVQIGNEEDIVTYGITNAGN
jgi:hypothetical protein